MRLAHPRITQDDYRHCVVLFECLLLNSLTRACNLQSFADDRSSIEQDGCLIRLTLGTAPPFEKSAQSEIPSPLSAEKSTSKRIRRWNSLGRPEIPFPKVDIVTSAGRQTGAVNRELRRASKCRNMQRVGRNSNFLGTRIGLKMQSALTRNV